MLDNAYNSPRAQKIDQYQFEYVENVIILTTPSACKNHSNDSMWIITNNSI